MPPASVSARLIAASRAVAADLPLPADWPARDAVPIRQWTHRLRSAGWPTYTWVIRLPQGAGRPFVLQPVTVVPVAWLEELAVRMGQSFEGVCRWTIDG